MYNQVLLYPGACGESMPLCVGSNPNFSKLPTLDRTASILRSGSPKATLLRGGGCRPFSLPLLLSCSRWAELCSTRNDDGRLARRHPPMVWLGPLLEKGSQPRAQFHAAPRSHVPGPGHFYAVDCNGSLGEQYPGTVRCWEKAGFLVRFGIVTRHISEQGELCRKVAQHEVAVASSR